MFNACGQGAARILALTGPTHTHTITIHYLKKIFLKADTHTHTTENKAHSLISGGQNWFL